MHTNACYCILVSVIFWPRVFGYQTYLSVGTAKAVTNLLKNGMQVYNHFRKLFVLQ